MAAINLSTYGLFWKLDPSKMSSPVPEKYKIAQAIRIDTKIVITSEIGARPVVSFKLGEKLGQGSYGVTYKTDLVINAKEVVVKIIRKTKDYNTKDIITEVISQIIAYSASNGINSSTKYGKIEGPFVPNLYMLAEDQSSYYILMERMHSDFKKYIETDDAADTFRDSIIMICLALKSLYETVKFNHRDFKPDNIMFNKEGGLRIIDFGFCCLNYGGMKISSTYEAPKQLLKHCNVRSRDINALFYYILNYTRFKTLACPIKRVIKALMYAKQGDPLEWKKHVWEI
jgi:serine/threonine protein kinase